MKLATFQWQEAERIGVIHDEEVRILPRHFGDMVAIATLGIDNLGQIASAAAASSEVALLQDIRLLPPIRRFRRDVLCTGWNYWDHFEEGIGRRDGQEVPPPTAPTFFTKAPTAVIGPYDDIAFDPRISQKWDYEGEIVAIIGQQIRSTSSATGDKAVFGYCLANDISQRDLQRRHGGQWLKGKSIDGTTPVGPFIVTADEVDLPEVRIQTYVNGQIRQDAYAKQMAFPIGPLIAELSFGMSLYPGDLVLTGTPSGIGNAMTPPAFLKEGDEIIVRADGFGELRNKVRGQPLYGESDIDIAV